MMVTKKNNNKGSYFILKKPSKPWYIFCMRTIGSGSDLDWLCNPGAPWICHGTGVSCDVQMA